MNAEQLARALGFKRSGNQWVGRCVAHDDRNPSMIIFDGRNGTAQVRCLAGCLSFEIIEALRSRGLWHGSSFTEEACDELDRKRRNIEIELRDGRRVALALEIWGNGLDPIDTPVEHYVVEARGLALPKDAASVIRYHPACPNGAEVMPALVALMRDVETFKPVAINRLFLDVDQNKKTGGKMLGRAGNAAMMLTSRFDTFWDDLSFCPQLCVTEGLETGLAVYQWSAGQERTVPVWALGSAGAIARLPVIFAVGELLICADHDDAGVAAGFECADRWNATTHQKARVLTPEQPGTDYADYPKHRVSHA